MRTGVQEKPGKIKKSKSKKTRRATRRAKQSGPEVSQPAQPVTSPRPQEAIERYITGHPGELRPKDIASALGIARVQTVNLILSKLAYKGSIHKAQDGTFRT
jgi:uncharacterized membrane protein